MSEKLPAPGGRDRGRGNIFEGGGRSEQKIKPISLTELAENTEKVETETTYLAPDAKAPRKPLVSPASRDKTKPKDLKSLGVLFPAACGGVVHWA
jgi:hypothetical protein